MKRSRHSPLLAIAAAVATLLEVAAVRTFAFEPVSAAGIVDAGNCPLDPGAYEAQGYLVRRVLVRGVFDLFQLVPSTSVRLAGVDLPIEGQSFRVDRTVAAARALEGRLHEPLPGLESRFAVTIVMSNIERCSDDQGGKRLDIRYRTLTSHLSPVSGLTLESKEAQRQDPAAAAGAVAPMRRFKIAPVAAYNASDGFQAGGTLSLRQVAPAIDSVDAQAVEAPRAHLLRAAMSATRTPHLKALDTGSWQVSVKGEERAGALDDRFDANAVTGQFTGQTVPFGSSGALFRFGGSFEGGHQQALIASTAASGSAVVDDRHGYAALRAAGGVAAGGRHYSTAASYGVLLGHVGGGGTVSYRKHIADFAWDSEAPIGDHTALRIEGRLNAGWLLGGEAAPIAERFRGGNREDTFLESGSWNIRSNPLLRSLPSNRLDRTSADAALGGDRFVAMNLTLSAPVWRYPLIPVWLSRSPGFSRGIQAAKETGRNQAIVYYQSQDPAQKLMAADAARVASVLDTLFDRLSAAQDSVAPAHRDAFDDCLDAADTARDKMNHLRETGFGPVATNVVPGVASACVAELAAALPARRIVLAARRVEDAGRVDRRQAETDPHRHRGGEGGRRPQVRVHRDGHVHQRRQRGGDRTGGGARRRPSRPTAGERSGRHAIRCRDRRPPEHCQRAPSHGAVFVEPVAPTVGKPRCMADVADPHRPAALIQHARARLFTGDQKIRRTIRFAVLRTRRVRPPDAPS